MIKMGQLKDSLIVNNIPEQPTAEWIVKGKKRKENQNLC